MTKADIQQVGLRGEIGSSMTAVIAEGPDGKLYRLPTSDEIRAVEAASREVAGVFEHVPFGVPHERLTEDAKGNTWCVLYGIDEFHKLFSDRQLLVLGTLTQHTRAAVQAAVESGYPPDWVEAIIGMLSLCVDRVADRSSLLSWWQTTAQKVGPTFTRFALPMTWDHSEICPWADASGGYAQAIEWVAEVVEHLSTGQFGRSRSETLRQSSVQGVAETFDLVVTDPPYYDAIGYCVLMDFYHVWLRRVLHGLSGSIDAAFDEAVGPKWDAATEDGELVDDAARFGGDRERSRAAYEEGMYRVFAMCRDRLAPDGRFVVVFAHKRPDAWGALVSGMIRAGFVVDASWPIQTERVGRIRSVGSAALSSSVWLACKKRPGTARPGWDTRVLEEMRESIGRRLRDFWDAGIRGPDFVWAATGPALEAYSKHPVVKKANQPGQLMTVSEFLRHVRRIVVDFVVGRVLSGNGDLPAGRQGTEDVSSLDDVTTYYLLHRHDFGMADAPIGACILYALSCNLSDGALADQYDILVRTGKSSSAAQDDEEEDLDEDESGETPALREEGSGSQVKLKPWNQRKRKGMGYDAEGRPAPLVDQVHRLMHLWKAGDVVKVDEYLDDRGLRHHALFHQLLQALIELAPAGSDERSLLESISNHVAARGVRADHRQLVVDV